MLKEDLNRKKDQFYFFPPPLPPSLTPQSEVHLSTWSLIVFLSIVAATLNLASPLRIPLLPLFPFVSTFSFLLLCLSIKYLRNSLPLFLYRDFVMSFSFLCLHLFFFFFPAFFTHPSFSFTLYLPIYSASTPSHPHFVDVIA